MVPEFVVVGCRMDATASAADVLLTNEFVKNGSPGAVSVDWLDELGAGRTALVETFGEAVVVWLEGALADEVNLAEVDGRADGDTVVGMATATGVVGTRVVVGAAVAGAGFADEVGIFELDGVAAAGVGALGSGSSSAVDGIDKPAA